MNNLYAVVSFKNSYIFSFTGITLTESVVNIHIKNTLTDNDRLSTTWIYDQSDKIKIELIHTILLSRLLYGCTTWNFTKL